MATVLSHERVGTAAEAAADLPHLQGLLTALWADLQRGQTSGLADGRRHAGAHSLVVASAGVHTSSIQLMI